MSERKVLNKYYPPDFDPSKIPRLHLSKDRQYTVRLMAPCNMRCKTCGEYIYKGKKFNSRKETVQGEDYLGIKIFRFYIKCTRCLAEITFKTDPQNADYIVEHGATRNFQALKLAEEQAEKEQREEAEEEASNPMKLLEKRTKASKYEMETLENLEELKDLNQRQANVDFDSLLQQNAALQLKAKKTQEEEDEALIQSVFGQKYRESSDAAREDDGEDEEEIVEEIESDDARTPPPTIFSKRFSDILSTEDQPPKKKLLKSSMFNLVKKKGAPKPETSAKDEANQPKQIEANVRSALSLLGAYSDTDSE